MAQRWTDQFWAAYTGSPIYAPVIQRAKDLGAKPPYVQGGKNPNARTEEEEHELTQLRQGLPVGFCIAGYVLPDRTPEAYQILFDPLAAKPQPVAVPMGNWGFWGAPNIISRLIFGRDEALRDTILASGKWSGSPKELDTTLDQFVFNQQVVLPIREAVDFIHSCIAATIKAMKFSTLSQICGGPIEIAVITTDRQFRWVRHKSWHSAITEGEHDVRPQE